jgi:hypothetical protein
MAEELRYYLTTNVTALTTSNTWVNKAQHSPNTGATLHESAGMAPSLTFGAAPNYENPRIQIVARSTTYPAARSLAENVYRVLTAVDSVYMTTGAGSTSQTAYLSIDPVQTPFPLGEDETGRYLMACNYQVKKELST